MWLIGGLVMAHCSQLNSVSNIAEYQKSRLVRRNSFTYQKGTVVYLSLMCHSKSQIWPICIGSTDSHSCLHSCSQDYICQWETLGLNSLCFPRNISRQNKGRSDISENILYWFRKSQIVDVLLLNIWNSFLNPVFKCTPPQKYSFISHNKYWFLLTPLWIFCYHTLQLSPLTFYCLFCH